MGTAEQTRIGADPREPSGTRQIDEAQRPLQFEFSEVASLKLGFSNQSNSGFLSEAFNETAMHIASNVQDSVLPIGRIETVAAGSAKEERSFIACVQTKEGRSNCQM
jgi:hypothetical protein